MGLFALRPGILRLLTDLPVLGLSVLNDHVPRGANRAVDTTHRLTPGGG